MNQRKLGIRSLVLLTLLFVVGCEDKIETGSPKEYRYADFVAIITPEWITLGGGSTHLKKMTVKFTATRAGAYLLQSGDQFEKFVSPVTESDTTREFTFSSDHIVVIFSDGKSIERTVVKYN